MSLFISYTRSDDTRVRAIKNDLERMGRSVWLDHQIHGGERWWQEIIQQIQAADVFIFALSNESWQSRPCRAELEYAEQLRVPVIPVQVGPRDRYIKIAEQQIIDYRERSADAVLELMQAVNESAAAPRQLPSPLPEPPSVPFEYLHRIASRIDVHSIPREGQGQIIDELRRRLSEENDDTARRDILQLFRQLRDRQELTVPHAAEIDEILQGAEAKTVRPAADGATRLPPADHWRREKAADSTRKAAETSTLPRTATQPPVATQPLTVTQPPAPLTPGSGPSASGWQKQKRAPDAGSGAGGAAEPSSPSQTPAKPPAWLTDASGQPPPSPSQSGTRERRLPSQPGTSERSLPSQPGSSGRPPSSPGPSVKITPPAAPGSQGKVPPWLADMVGGSGTPGTGANDPGGSAGAASSTRRSDPESHSDDARQWWPAESREPFPGEQPGPPPSPSRSATSDGRFAFIGAALGSMGIPLSLLSLGDSSFVTVVTTLLLLGAVLGLSMAVVAATRREPWARVAVVLGVAGLISAIVALVAGIS